MRNFLRKRRAGYPLAPIMVAVVFLLACTGAYVTHVHAAPPDLHDVAAQEKYWEGRIRAVGGAGAYEEFARSVRSDDPGTQHGAAHVFGDALYSALGLPGLSVCDSRFSYGCYHEFIGRAIADQGMAVITVLSAECRALSSAEGCQHGIGHGLVAHLGYAPSDLAQAVSICSGLPGEHFIDGCYGGAFMEYNMRTLVDVNAPPRAIDQGGLLAPCESFTGLPRQSCALLQPQWWATRRTPNHLSGEPLFSQMGALCKEFGDSASVRACFEGIGWMAPALAAYDPAPTVRLCDASSQDSGLRLYCLSYAASLFETVGLSVDMGKQVCADLPPDSLKYCDAYASGAANFNHPIDLPQSAPLE